MANEDLVRKHIRKRVDKIDVMIRKRYVYNLETKHIPEIKDVILQDYDIDLSGTVTDRKSRTNPIFYRDEFDEALNEFEWIDMKLDYVTLITPETDTFNWNQGRLKIIELIVTGLAGLHIEVDEKQYLAMYEKRPIIQAFDKAVPRSERIYVLRLTGDVRRRWRNSFTGLNWVRYPFSNTSSIDIFDSANLYVQDNIESWRNKSIAEVMREVKG